MLKTTFLIILCIFTICAINSNAQQKIIKRDTINLHGYIYDEKGKPIKFLYLESTQLDVDYNDFKVNSTTDTNGYFNLKGAKFYDTIKVGEHAIYNTPPFYNNDSRYMVIYLSSRIIDINSANPVEIKSKHTKLKVKPTFNIKPIPEVTRDYFEIHIPACFPGGVVKFENFIKDNLYYPQNAIKNNTEGTVQVEFQIQKDGSLADFNILKGIGYGCDQEVINILKKSPKWRPAIDNGRPYMSNQIVSVRFSLIDN